MDSRLVKHTCNVCRDISRLLINQKERSSLNGVSTVICWGPQKNKRGRGGEESSENANILECCLPKVLLALRLCHIIPPWFSETSEAKGPHKAFSSKWFSKYCVMKINTYNQHVNLHKDKWYFFYLSKLKMTN